MRRLQWILCLAVLAPHVTEAYFQKASQADPPESQQSGSSHSSSSQSGSTPSSSTSGPAPDVVNPTAYPKRTPAKRQQRRGAASACGNGSGENCPANTSSQQTTGSSGEAPTSPQQGSGGAQQKDQISKGTGNIPVSAPVPRSDSEGVSSSRETKIDSVPPPGSTAPGAIDDSSEMHAWNPHLAEKSIEVGDFYFKRGNYKAAISRYREALQWKSGDAIATFRLAQALEKDGQATEARDSYQAYLKILPNGEFAREATAALARLK